MNKINHKNFPWRSPTKLVLDEAVEFDSKVDSAFFIGDDLTIFNGIWHVHKGTEWDCVTYFWDGPEDKIKPGYPVTWFATLIHDLGCKYCNSDPKTFPYSRFQIDRFFFKLLLKVSLRYKYPLSILYFIAVTTYSVFATIKNKLSKA